MSNPSAISLVVEVNEAAFAAEVEQATLPVFVDFWAPWCGPCKALAPLLDQLAELYKGQIKFVKINGDENPALMKRFNVRALPTLLMFQGGQQVDSVKNGSKAHFTNMLDKHAQRPVEVAAVEQRTFSAFKGDATVRDAAVDRLKQRMEAGQIVKTDYKAVVCAPDDGRFSILGAVLDTSDASAVENTYGIPYQLGRLEEAAHGQLLMSAEGEVAEAVRLSAADQALVLSWWTAIPAGADLQMLPARFLAWVLQDAVTRNQLYPIDEATQGVMADLSNLHKRFAAGDSPSDDEWRAVRNAAGVLVKRDEGKERKPGDAPSIALQCVEMLAWPIYEIANGPAEAVWYLQFEVSSRAVRESYTAEQWVERNAPEAAMDARRKVLEPVLAGFDKADDWPEEIKKEFTQMRADWSADWQRRQPVEAKVSAAATQVFAERMHFGLMQALNETTAGA